MGADYSRAARFAAAALVALKLLLFYSLIGVQSHFVAVWLMSCLLAGLIFSAFRVKWIPAAIHLLISALMFLDLTFSSFFNRYLSVDMIGAADVVGSIGDSVLELIRPIYFLMPADALAIMAMLAAMALRRRRAARAEGEARGIEGAEAAAGPGAMACDAWGGEAADAVADLGQDVADAGADLGQEAADAGADLGQEAADAGAEPGQEAADAGADLGQETAGAEADTGQEAAEADEGADLGQEAADVEAETAATLPQALSFLRPAAARVLPFLRAVARHRAPASAGAIAALIAVVLWNPAQAQTLTAISNQELYAFHVKDALGGLFAGSGGGDGGDFQYLFYADDYAVEKDGPLFGVAEGRNLIVIQVESLQNFVVGLEYNGQEITPNLNRLIGENSVYFDNFYQQVGGGNTSDAEFAVNNSICGVMKSYTYELFQDNVFRGLPVLLSEKGYDTAVFHAHEDRGYWSREGMYPAQGFGRFFGGLELVGGDYEMTEWMGWGLTDSEFFKQTLPMMKSLREPFYSFVITLSNHHPFLMLDHYSFIDLLPEDEGSLVGNYLRSAAYTDYAIGLFIDMLKDDGLYERSVIAVYGDHQGLTMEGDVPSDMRRLLGRDYDFDAMMRVPLIISLPGGADIRQTSHTAGGQIDFMPTMAYLMGFESLDTLYLGHNLLTIREGFAPVQSYMLKGSFFDNDTAFEMSRDGIFANSRAWRLATGESVPLEECRAGYGRAMAVIDASDYILYNDLVAEWGR
ncbi:MAG: sulfatase-like hydrolase/transferase [Clostridiales Family XIII bacterium]|jgi:phosphoglycerol transferase MdoB-like AlkP superfamily enzyme|nr:sulfatase-like hydrolase/transferase [Clostridiales Family XIII bacterium]